MKTSKLAAICCANCVIATVCFLFAREWAGAIGFAASSVSLYWLYIVAASFENLCRASCVMDER